MYADVLRISYLANPDASSLFWGGGRLLGFAPKPDERDIGGCSRRSSSAGIWLSPTTHLHHSLRVVSTDSSQWLDASENGHEGGAIAF